MEKWKVSWHISDANKIPNWFQLKWILANVFHGLNCGFRAWKHGGINCQKPAAGKMPIHWLWDQMTSQPVVSLLKTQEINLHPINFHFSFRVKIYQVILELLSRWKTTSLGAFQLTPGALVVKTVPKEGAVSEKHWIVDAFNYCFKFREIKILTISCFCDTEC